MKNIQGIDKVIFSEFPDSCTILVEGDTGVLKTTFVMECIKTYLNANNDCISLYVSLKEDGGFFRKNTALKQLIDQDRLHIIDYEGLMECLSSSIVKRNIFEGISSIVSSYKKKYGERLSTIAIDPVNMLENNINKDDVRRVLFHFFSRLNELKTKNWIVMESYGRMNNLGATLPYHFLADGIISLGMMETLDNVIRYLEIIKMRGVSHSLKKFQISYKRDGIKILGAIHGS